MSLKKSLSEEDKNMLLSSLNILNSLKAQYGEHCLNFESVIDQFSLLKKKHEEDTQILKAQILKKQEDFQSATHSLLSAYGIDPQEGSWTLNVMEGHFSREQDSSIPLKRVSARKPKKVK